MFHAEVVIFELFAFFFRSLYYRSQVTPYLGLGGGTALSRFVGNFPLGRLEKQPRVARGLAENSAFLLQQRNQNVQRGDFRFSKPSCSLLRLHQRFLKFCC